MSAQEFIEVRVTQLFSASPQQVFNMWLDPEQIPNWMFGPKVREEQILAIDIDPKVRGRFSFRVLREGEELDHHGEYVAIDRPRRLAFTWAVRGHGPNSRININIIALGDGCELTLTHLIPPEAADYKDRVTESWKKMLNHLSEAL